jgi:hypothetical protein
MKKLPKVLVLLGLLTISACIQIPTFPAPERDEPEGPGGEAPSALANPEQGPLLASAIQENPSAQGLNTRIPETSAARISSATPLA